MSEFTFEQKKDVVIRAERKESKTKLAREYGVSRKTIHDWINSYELEGDDGLMPKSKRPKTSPNKTPAEIELLVIKLKQKNRNRVAAKISEELLGMGIELSSKTITKILVEHGEDYYERTEGEHTIRTSRVRRWTHK